MLDDVSCKFNCPKVKSEKLSLQRSFGTLFAMLVLRTTTQHPPPTGDRDFTAKARVKPVVRMKRIRAREVGISIGSLPLLWSLFHVVKVISSSLGGTWADRLPRRRLIVAGWLVYAATYLAFGLATQPMHMWGLFVVYGAYYGLTEPAEKALVKDLAPPSMRGRAYGVYNFILGASAVPAGLLTGVLWQTFGPLAALATGAVLPAVASLAILVSVRDARTA
jgi:MFS family permease